MFKNKFVFTLALVVSSLFGVLSYANNCPPPPSVAQPTVNAKDAVCPDIKTAIAQINGTALAAGVPSAGYTLYEGTSTVDNSKVYYYTVTAPTAVTPQYQLKSLAAALHAPVQLAATNDATISCAYLGGFSGSVASGTPVFDDWNQVIVITSNGEQPPPPPAGNVTVSTDIEGLPSSATVSVRMIGTSSDTTKTMATGVQSFGTLPSGFYTVQASDYTDTSTTPATNYEAQITGQYTLTPPTTTVIIKYAKFSPHVPGEVPDGWTPNKVTMATIYDNSASAKAALLTRPVAGGFTYAGSSGGGDPGCIIPLIQSKIPQTISDLTDPRTNNTQTMPIFVVYTANASGGGTAGALTDIEDEDTLNKHYQTLIIYAQGLESYYLNASNPIRSTVVFNPDLLGSILKDKLITPSTPLVVKDANGKQYTMREVLINAVQVQVGSKGPQPDQSLFPTDTFADYVQTINWIMGTFAPDIPYGWEDADWAGETEGNTWLHITPDAGVPAKVAVETQFLQSTHVFDPVKVTTPGGTITTTQPSFLGFDKYGANPIYNGNSDKINEGYLFNTQDWDNYMAYTSQVAKNLNMPLMLFQMPGAHLPETGERTPFENLATTPNYIFGASSAGLNFGAFSGIPGNIISTVYHKPSDMTSGAYLLLNGQSVWSQVRVSELQQDKVFAILWGAGAFATGIIPETGNTFDDGGWLYNMIKNAPSYVFQPQAMVPPDPSTLPVYPEGQSSYVGGSRVTTSAKQCAYQCIQANWCRQSGFGPPGSGPNWSMAWYSLTKAPVCPVNPSSSASTTK